MKKIFLKRDVWLSDEDLLLEFPDNWEVNIYGNQRLPSLSDREIEFFIDNPIYTKSIFELAESKRSAILLVDDITRPTPTHRIISAVIDRLIRSGISENRIRILFAGGTHPKPLEEEIIMKIGKEVSERFQILRHDCKEDCVNIGKTTLGTPVHINRHVMESDIKIGISSVYPHPIAGFSGGSKILALGAAGIETIKILHDTRRGANNRTGDIKHPFRDEINEISNLAGFDFCINITLNQDRMISGVYAGDPQKAFSDAVFTFKRDYKVKVEPNADVIVVDMYPFDMDFQFAFDRGLWPFKNSKKGSKKIILANCTKGIGGHELFPVSNPLPTRIVRRIENFNLNDILQIPERIQAIKKIFWRRRLDIVVISPYILKNEIKKVLPRGQVLCDWDSTIVQLRDEFKGRSDVSVAIYRTAPLMLPF
jgi:nickel-dependent lactate racemase